MVDINQRITAPIKAGIKPSIVKPGISLATKSNRSAFITNVKRPRVRIFMGRVRIKITGFMSAFIIPSPIATINAVVKELT